MIQKDNILVVDDSPDNLRLLTRILSEHGYKVRPAPNGAHALRAAAKYPPDLILLDVMMPDMNGYEVCEKLKKDEKTSDIPIIFISALNDEFDKVSAFSAGGVDFITKPFQENEVLARITTHLSIKKMQQDLKEKNEKLKKQNQELDAFAHTVAHDIKNPLCVILSSAKLMKEDIVKKSLEEISVNNDLIIKYSNKIYNIIDGLMLLTGVRKQSIELTLLNMKEITNNVMDNMKKMINEYNGKISKPDEWPDAYGYSPWIEEVWINYISNALKYGGEPPVIKIGADVKSNDMIKFWVQDNGKGILGEDQGKLFTEFTRLNKIQENGYGLGLSIVERIITKLGGKVGVESSPENGSIFYFTLPSKL